MAFHMYVYLFVVFHPLFGSALASLLVPVSAYFLPWEGQAQQAPPSAQDPLPRRLPGLSSRPHSFVEWRASTPACATVA